MSDLAHGAAGVVGRALGAKLALKTAIVGAALFLALLLVAGALADPGAALTGDPCGERGLPAADTDVPAGPHQEEQLVNAQVIDEVAAGMDLPGQATLVGLMTALQESSLLNIEHGDRDSLGLFQQRPSQGWGTEEQIMDPVYSSTMFFQGGDGGDPPGLTDIGGWHLMAPGDAAQAVQRSAHPELYAGQEGPARAIAAQAGIDLNRPGTTDPGEESQDTPPDPGQPEECYPDEHRDGATAGGEFTDAPDAAWPPEVSNGYTTDQAIEWARTEAAHGGQHWYRLCLAFVAQAYGWNYSGVDYAIDHYEQMPPEIQHDGDREPPPGALLYWDTGQRAGHVALYLGNGQIASNDIERPGYIDIVPATAPETEWAATYVGWAPPYFPKAG